MSENKNKRDVDVRKLLMIGLVLSLAGCSGGGSAWGGRLNPFNWFGGGSSVDERRTALTPRGGYGAEAEYRQLADQITELSVERGAVGIIVAATALMPTQGWFNAELVRIDTEDENEAVFEFRVEGPLAAKAVGPARSREITAGAFLTTQDAAGLRTIRVVGARNTRSVRR